jgi:phosphonate transport system substrate-binding protein
MQNEIVSFYAVNNVTMKKGFITFSLLLIAVFLTSAQNPVIDFYLTPSLSAELLNKNGSFIKEFLEKETGLSIQLKIPDSYDELVDHFNSTVPCFGMMSSQSYVLANQKYGATVKLRTIRFGHSVYYGMIITRAGSGIKELKDLQGKSFAFTDELSTSGYLYPKKMLERNKIKLAKELFAKTHDEVVRLVYEGKADAGAAFYSPPSTEGTIRDARARLKGKFPDVENKIIIVSKTDPIPNDPVVFSKNFDPQVARTLYTALVKLATDPKGKQVLLDLYGTEGFVKASDSDYNSIRSVMGLGR